MRSPAECRPAAADELTVPAQQGGGGEEQAPSGQPAPDGGQDQAINRNQLRPAHLSREDGDLMPQSQQF